MIKLEEITVKQYKAGDYIFDESEKYQAGIIVKVLNDSDKKVCGQCSGKGKKWKAVPKSMDNGGEGYTSYFAEYHKCGYCNGNGFLTKKVDWV